MNIFGTSWLKNLQTLASAVSGCWDASISVGAEDTNVVAVTIQLKDENGDDLTDKAGVYAWLSDDDNGDDIAATAPSAGWAIGTDGLLIPVVADKAAILISEDDGDIDLEVTEAGADTFYLNVLLPNGTVVTSDALTFTA